MIEFKPGAMVADRKRRTVPRRAKRNRGRGALLELPRGAGSALSHGYLLRAFSAPTAALPMQRQAKRVKVEGELLRLGEYVLPENGSVQDAIRAAGGFTSGAHLFPTGLTRLSVQRTQQENYDRALGDLEPDIARAAGSQGTAFTEGAASLEVRSAATQRLIDRLRALRPSGRIALQLEPGATDPPGLALEDGDRIFIPARPTTVGVFGSVFNAATYLHSSRRTIGEYLRLGGGSTKGADEASIFVGRANGNVISGRQSASPFNRGDVAHIPSEPGDTVFVPEEMDKTTFLQAAKDWTQIVFQFGLGVAGIKSAVK